MVGRLRMTPRPSPGGGRNATRALGSRVVAAAGGQAGTPGRHRRARVRHRHGHRFMTGFAELLQQDALTKRNAVATGVIPRGERARQRHHRNLSRFGWQQSSMLFSWGDVVSSVIELRQRRLADQTSDSSAMNGRPGHAVFTATAAGGVLNFVINAEQSLRPVAPRHRTSRRDDDGACDWKWRTRAPASRLKTRPSLPAVLHDQGGGRGHRSRPVGELWHDPIARRHDWYRGGDAGGAAFFTVPSAGAQRDDPHHHGRADVRVRCGGASPRAGR